MVVAGLAVAILGPYSLYLLMPHAPRVSSEETKSAPPGIDLDISELDTLPDSLRDGAMLLLTAETPELPEAIANLAVASGENVLRPVSEAVEETQPVLYWSAAFGEPPYTVSITDDKGLVIARAQGIQNTSWMVLTPLRRGGEYTWLVTSPTAKSSKRLFASWMTVKPRYGGPCWPRTGIPTWSSGWSRNSSGCCRSPSGNIPRSPKPFRIQLQPRCCSTILRAAQSLEA